MSDYPPLPPMPPPSPAYRLAMQNWLMLGVAHLVAGVLGLLVMLA
jgi:hypothetical protein